MSIQAINYYHNAVHKIYQFSGQNHEQAIKDEFKRLLNAYCEKKNLLVVSEINIKNKQGDLIRPDGIVKNNLRLDLGYWESKANVDLEKEIKAKINAGYPLINTLFQDEKTAILYQNDVRCFESLLENEQDLNKLLTQFVQFENKEITAFNVAIEQFKNDLPYILEALRNMIVIQEKSNSAFINARQNFLTVCQHSINPAITPNDINEMLLQHILTEEIFTSIFSDAQFHRENNIAKELYKVENTFFSGTTKRNTLAAISHYYTTIKAHSSKIADHHDKQFFLKSIYENFYKAYNPKAADKMGIVYTPNEIVKFQIEAVDYLLGKHFSKTLADDGVKILDPCTGTGTYICDLIDYLPPHRLAGKYKNDIYANELGLLPYYIANLNVEYTYQQKMNEYVEFEHICWVDTLDNASSDFKGSTSDLFGLSIENTERIKKQNSEKISVIIGNPPYNANQQNENDNNKNREYFGDSKKKIGGIDGRIKDTYIKESAAQKTKLYDMYSRFYRWASDRINNEQGIVAFVTNNSFINSKTFDGFRKCIRTEFDFAYIIDTRSDVRANPKIAGTTHNVFGIQTGVALMFLIKTNANPEKSCRIFYTHLTDEMPRKEKLEWLKNTPFKDIPFDSIHPDEKGNWLNLTDNDFESLMPVCDKEVKAGKSKENNAEAIFKLYSLGVVTARDEWVYDDDKQNLENKVKHLIKIYNSQVESELDYSIKWSRAVKKDLEKGVKYQFNEALIVESLYRPFVKKKLYFSKQLNEMQYQLPQIFVKENHVIGFLQGERQDFSCFCSDAIPNYAMFSLDYAQCLPLYVYDKTGKPQENITNWALNQFKTHYACELTKTDIFHYVYAVLHNPIYREKYEQNLKREFPRIPFYDNFSQWVEWGKTLMELHLNYETVEPYPLKRVDSKTSKIPKAKLKADKINGVIELDENTSLSGIPVEAWEYKLGNRSALEWILDQYKEKKPKDATIAEKFHVYRFADYKESVIDLLMRVCRVSIETVGIVELMKQDKN